MIPSVAGTPYGFGPFELTLPDGWSGTFDEGVHDLLPPDEDFVIQISGYEKSDPFEPADLQEMAAEQSPGAVTSSIELASGLSGMQFDRCDGGYTMRFWLVCHGTALAAVTLTCPDDGLATAALPAQMVVGTIRPMEAP